MNIVNVGYRSTNYYVLADTRPRLLFDAGWPGTLPDFQHACKRAGVQLSQIPYCLVSHYHPDHAGLVQELKIAGMKLIVVDLQLHAIPALSGHVKPQDRYVEIDPHDNVVTTIADSRKFLSGLGIAGQMVYTPGHSDDSITLLLDDGSAFTGDLTHPALVAEDNEALNTSWDTLRALGASTIYPAHGTTWRLA
jgi:ribonuclease/clavin/mitogillin